MLCSINNQHTLYFIKKLQLVLVMVFISLLVKSQPVVHPINTITTRIEYKESVAKNGLNKMVELKQQIPTIVYDLRYATLNNFMHRRMYSKGTSLTFMRKPAVAALKKVQEDLNKRGLGLKVFDAYRPWSVSNRFWELVKDERYVANPAKGSNHNRGTAIDLTIIDLNTGAELAMGTGFDNFTDSAHHSFTQFPDSILKNRELLKVTMERYGFSALSSEWWHYTFSDGIAYAVLDLSFKQLKHLKK